MSLEFPFGKYNGKTPERVAWEDYCYLRWSYDNGIWRLDKYTNIQNRVHQIIYGLDNLLVSEEFKCRECDNPPEVMKIVIVYGSNGKPEDVIVSEKNIYCNRHISNIPQEYIRNRSWFIYPIKFSTAFQLDRPDCKFLGRAVARVIWRLAGFNVGGHITQKRLEEFLETLTMFTEVDPMLLQSRA